MISDAIAIYDLIQNLIYQGKNINIKSKIKKAIFDWDGLLLEGSKDIKLSKKPIFSERQGINVEFRNYWLYVLDPIEDYFYVYFPLNLVGVIAEHPVDSKNSLAHNFPKNYLENENVFRFVQTPNGRVYSSGDLPNIKVKFIVVAYHKSILLDIKGN